MDSVRMTGRYCPSKSRVMRMGGKSSVSATGVLVGLLMLVVGGLAASGILMGVGFFTMAAAVIYLRVVMDEGFLATGGRSESVRC